MKVEIFIDENLQVTEEVKIERVMNCTWSIVGQQVKVLSKTTIEICLNRIGLGKSTL